MSPLFNLLTKGSHPSDQIQLTEAARQALSQVNQEIATRPNTPKRLCHSTLHLAHKTDPYCSAPP